MTTAAETDFGENEARLDPREKARRAHKARLREQARERRVKKEREALEKILDQGGVLAGMTDDQKRERILAVVEASAMGHPVPTGLLTAAKAWLDFYRWRKEMEEGRPPQRLDIKNTRGVVVVTNRDELAQYVGVDGKLRLPGNHGEVDIEGSVAS